MKVVIVLAALLVVSQAAKTLCPKVVCDSSLADGTCFSATNTSDTYEIKIKKCDSGQFCNVLSFASATNNQTASCANTTTPTAVTDQKPGYDCTQNSECASNDCGSNGCTGVAKDATCVAYSTITTSDWDKICGANLYCNTTDNKCDDGKAAGTDCTFSYECAGRAGCVNSKCTDLSTVASGDSCAGGGSDYYCAAGLYCNTSAECAAAPEYTTGTVGGSCTANADCSGSCLCGLANPDGNGFCGPLSSGSIGKAALDGIRSSIASASFNCPLGVSKLQNGGCAGTYETGGATTQKTESCYKDFLYAGGLLPQPGSSAFGLYASVLGFVAYLLA